MKPTPSLPPATTSDRSATPSLLANLVDQLADAVAIGEPADIESLTRAHPELARPLRDAYQSLIGLCGIASESRSAVSPQENLQVANQSEITPNSALRTPGYPLGAALETLGDFRILRELGRGGMGIVYEAEQLTIGRRVALKVLPFAAMVDHRALQRFRNEIRAVGTLDHPNIVAVHFVGEERGVNYYAMQLVRGQSLAEVIAALRQSRDESQETRAGIVEPPLTAGTDAKLPSGQQPIANSQQLPHSALDTQSIAAIATERTSNPRAYFRRVAELGIQAAEALAHAHDQGIVHRDIKPANLLLDTGGKLYVTDFGLARLETDASMTASGDLVGTLRYMSPEQVSGNRATVDHRADIYALGVTLYELLALRPAFHGNDRAEVLSRVASETPAMLHRVDSRLPADLATIVGKAMEKEPADRYESAAALAEDFRAFAADRPITARPPSWAARTHKWARRHSTAMVTAVAVLLLASVGLAIAAAMVGRQRTIAEQNAAKADDNYQLALAALEETLAESVVGELIVEPIDEKRSELQRRGVDFYEQLAHKNGVAPTVWPAYQLLVFNHRLGEAFALEKTEPEAAAKAFTNAIALGERLVAATGRDPDNRAKLIHAIDDYANLLGNTGRNEEAIQESLRAARLIAQLQTSHPDFPLLPYLAGKNLYNRSVFHEKAGRMDEAERLCREALPNLENATSSDPDSTEVFDIRTLASCRYNLAFYLAQRGENEEAAQLWQKALTDWRALILMRPTSSEFNSRAGATLSNLATLERYDGDYAECRRLAGEAIVHQKRALNLTPTYDLAKGFLAKHYHELSLALSALRDREALAASAEDRVAHLPDVHSEYCEAAMSLGDCMEQLQADIQYTGDDRELLMDGYARRALELLAEASEQFDDSAALFTTAKAYVMLGDGLAEMEQPEEAQTAWESAIDLFRKSRASVPRQTQTLLDNRIKSTEQKLAALLQSASMN